jgi:hypothetical protein
MWTSEWQARYQCAALDEADGISDRAWYSMYFLHDMPNGISIAKAAILFLDSFLLSPSQPLWGWSMSPSNSVTSLKSTMRSTTPSGAAGASISGFLATSHPSRPRQ